MAIFFKFCAGFGFHSQLNELVFVKSLNVLERVLRT